MGACRKAPTTLQHIVCNPDKLAIINVLLDPGICPLIHLPTFRVALL